MTFHFHGWPLNLRMAEFVQILWIRFVSLFCFMCGHDPRSLTIQAHNREQDASPCPGSDVRCGGLGGKQLQEQIVGKLSI
jgi:hypothetical protein